MKNYDFKSIEKKWQERWEKSGAHKAKDAPDASKFYCLDFFPYPSGEGLHVGHWRGYVLSDIIARFQKLHGKEILHPMGYDAFGLPAENAAIKNNTHPKEFTQKAIVRFRKQLKQIGAMYDWDREINSSDPAYYKWTQWLFLQLYKAGLAYRKKAPVNWCPACKTVLANEQVIAGECERCTSKVIKKELTQWFFKITDYADRLLNNLDKLDWPERTKTLQRNWIGRSEGALVKFQVVGTDFDIDVFTSRPDTLFGATFLVLAPEHPIVQQITTSEQINAVEKYIENTREKSDIIRQTIEREKTGVFTGAYAINPASGEKIPVWIADYVLYFYGHGACMCVPAHDGRDFEFATKYNLPIKVVVTAQKSKTNLVLKKAYEQDGYLIDSDKFSGMRSTEAKEKIVTSLQKANRAEKMVNFRLRDWLISRQRYWGAPIPIVYCKMCGDVPAPEEELPIILPEDVEFHPKGESPLKQSKTFVTTKCPRCGENATRETDTMDTFVDSSWYYLRYTDPKNSREFANQKKIDNWMPVDLYVGGIEHATMHLLYARFVSMVLHDLKLVNFDPDGEPFKKLFNIGLIYLHGAKMSKSKGNVVNPDELVEQFGTDALRGYEMFVGPADQDSEWQVSGITGIFRFLEKVWQKSLLITNDKTSLDDLSLIHQTIKKVTRDIENFRFNTAIASLMSTFSQIGIKISKVDFEKLIVILSPIFPHVGEEIWQILGQQKSIFAQKWPTANEDFIKKEKIKIAVQVNGKLRDLIEVEISQDKNAIQQLALTDKVKKFVGAKQIKKTIYITGKVVNFVVE